eukprot:TRINITY_DN42104_c0_g1_i1.p1 TRINITY_DN42104_c0_g1~~TRINITY_DN42104_c0_g1_i1.p1  ORF type:complete len:452 (-),score=108.86 TRINITY_DN42104_c0_g1_i1:151-1506(-)
MLRRSQDSLIQPFLRPSKPQLLKKQSASWWAHAGLHAAVAAVSLLGAAHIGFVGSAGTAAPQTSAPAAASTSEFLNLAKQISIPLGALLLGVLVLQLGDGQQLIGKLMIYFGAQSGMNLYMKAVLSKAVVSEELKMKGVPAAFLVTGIQQLVSFVLFISYVGLVWNTKYRYMPKELKTPKEYVAVFCFSFTFAANIGLNNFSVSLLPVSLNLIIRSCLPLSTALSTIALGYLSGKGGWNLKAKEFLTMLAGVGFVVLATIAKAKGSGSGANKDDTEHLMLGVVVGVLSIFTGAINFVLAQFLGSQQKLNPVDTTCYMSLPAAFFLAFPVFLLPHPVSWPDFGLMTDWQVFLKLLELSPTTLALAVLSGLFAFSYNVLQYSMVQSLSATYTSFAGNFNKAATVVISLLCGFESLPSGHWGSVMLFAICGNFAAFSYYSYMKQQDGGKAAGGH